jgi:hypothetical protein
VEVSLTQVFARPVQGRHFFEATYGLKVAFFYAKLYRRILRPNWAALLPVHDAVPHSLRTALDPLYAEIQKLHQEATLAA